MGQGRCSHSAHLDLCSPCPFFQLLEWKTILQQCSALLSQDETWARISSAALLDAGGLTLHPLNPISKIAQREAPEVWKPELWLTFQQGTCSASPLKVLMAGIFKTAAQSGENRWTNRNPYFCRFDLPSFGKRGSGCSMKCYSKQCCDSSSIKILVPLTATAIFLADDSTKERVASCPGVSYESSPCQTGRAVLG